MKRDEIIGELVEAFTSRDERGFGKEMFRFHTELGYPPDAFLRDVKKELGLDKKTLLLIIHDYLYQIIEHKRMSGATEKNIQKARERNVRILERFLTCGELGVY